MMIFKISNVDTYHMLVSRPRPLKKPVRHLTAMECSKNLNALQRLICLNSRNPGQDTLQDFLNKSSFFFANEQKNAAIKLFAQTALACDKFIKMH
jgi:hypothetical protein